MGEARLGRRGWTWCVETGLRATVVAAVSAAAVFAPAAGAAGPDLPSVMVDERAAGSGGSFDFLIGPDSAAMAADGGMRMEDGAIAADPAPTTPGWTEATACEAGACWPAGCDPVGLLQKCHAAHVRSGHRWIGRVDALVLWRDPPPARPLVESGAIPVVGVLDANQLQSTATGGVKASALLLDGCSGNGWEGTYIFAGDFTAQRTLPIQDGFAYALAPPGIFGNNDSQPFDSGKATLIAQLQSAEFNRHLAYGPNVRWLAGFRWVQWHERFTLEDSLNDGVNAITDVYQNACTNDLYGGQIGVDARLFSLGSFRVDSLVKAGAYYNNAVQTSTYTTDDPANPGIASVTVGQSPASCSFVGEVGVTGVMPLARNLDFRFGYLGLWLTGLAQPTQQLSGQQVTPALPTTGTLTANGGTLLQGVTLGLEGRW